MTSQTGDEMPENEISDNNISNNNISDNKPGGSRRKKVLLLILVPTLILMLAVAVLTVVLILNFDTPYLDTPDNMEDVTGTVVDVGNISALCPDGWYNYPVKDENSRDPDAVDPNTLIFFYSKSKPVTWFDTTVGMYPYIKIVFDPGGLDVPQAGKDYTEIYVMQLPEGNWDGFNRYTMERKYSYMCNTDTDDENWPAPTVSVIVCNDGLTGFFGYANSYVEAILDSILVKDPSGDFVHAGYQYGTGLVPGSMDSANDADSEADDE